MTSFRYIILGGGVVAGYAAQAFAEGDLKEGELALISADDTLPYERPPLSKDFLAGESEKADILINDAAFYKEHGIETILETRIIAVDFQTKTLTSEDGQRFGYEKLLIATGSRLRKLDLPGADDDEIYYLRWFDQAQQIRNRKQQVQRALVLGGGFIGMECAAVFANDDIEVEWIFPDTRLMEGFFTPEMSRYFEDYYRQHGISLHPGRKAASFQRQDKTLTAILDNGDSVAADMVLAGIGVEPALALFEGTHLHIDGGIVVNEYLETNIDDVYAAGDVVNYRDVIFKKQRHIEHWDNAVAQGQHAAKVMLGDRQPFVHVPYFFSDEFDLSWEFWGDESDADWTITRGQINEGSFSLWWLNGERLVAAFVMDRPEGERQAAQQWIRQGTAVSAAMLEDESKPLQVDEEEASHAE